jgi:hypothetical protein
VLRRGLSVDPAERYPSMDALIADLSRQVEPAKVDRRLRLALGGLAAAALIASAIVALGPVKSADPAAPSAALSAEPAEPAVPTPSVQSPSVPGPAPAPTASSAAAASAPTPPASSPPRVRAPGKASLSSPLKPRTAAPAPNPDRLKNPF